MDYMSRSTIVKRDFLNLSSSTAPLTTSVVHGSYEQQYVYTSPRFAKRKTKRSEASEVVFVEEKQEERNPSVFSFNQTESIKTKDALI